MCKFCCSDSGRMWAFCKCTAKQRFSVGGAKKASKSWTNIPARILFQGHCWVLLLFLSPVCCTKAHISKQPQFYPWRKRPGKPRLQEMDWWSCTDKTGLLIVLLMAQVSKLEPSRSMPHRIQFRHTCMYREGREQWARQCCARFHVAGDSSSESRCILWAVWAQGVTQALSCTLSVVCDQWHQHHQGATRNADSQALPRILALSFPDWSAIPFWEIWTRPSWDSFPHL